MFKFKILISLLLIGSPVFAGPNQNFSAKTCLLTKSLPITDLVEKSGKIFVGNFLESNIIKQNGLVVRELHFKVVEPIKGVDSKNNTITIKEWARINSPFVNQVQKNQKYVFFFYENSARGLSSLVGFEQGLARVGKSNQLSFSKRVNVKIHNKSKLLLASEDKNVQDSFEIKTVKDLKDLCNSNS
ncbi:MAG: hypothetical protein RLZZ361_1033 [Cyanobacteriota bacterium]|jgi:hypothetical protein